MFRLFPFSRKKKAIFSTEENDLIVQSIRDAERRTCGEVRIFIESRCRYVDPIDRAYEIFANLKMQETEHRNAVLLYIAIKDKQLAVFGDTGIHERLGKQYWLDAVRKIVSNFNKDKYAEGIAACVKEIGESLHEHFPYDATEDKNELPDEIIFGN